MGHGEPCGSLPVTGVAVSAFYCHVHMAWHAIVSEHIQTGEDDVQSIRSEHMRFGPFDQPAEVLAWMKRALDVSEIFLPKPWDDGPVDARSV